MRNAQIASAVALAIGGASIVQAGTAPTLANCQSPNDTLYIAGSSAAQPAFAAALNNDAFGGAMSTFKASNGNFEAFCGVSTNASFAPINDTVVVHYRAEGGSVVGALPIVSGASIHFLNLAAATALGQTLTTTGTSETVGTTDGWGGTGTPSSLTTHTVEVGVTDVEPALLVGANYPSTYSATAFGSASNSQLANLTKTPLFDQVFGLLVNTNGFNGSGTGQTVNLSREAVANILTGKFTDWAQVPNASGSGTVSSTSVPIVVENREAGSGSRAGASAYFLGYNCSQTKTVINDPSPANDFYATADAASAVSGQPGGITYAQINTTGANISLAQLSGITPTNLAAATGQYDYWYEAQLIKGTIVSTGGSAIYTFLKTELAALASAPKVNDILAIPNVAGNTPSATPTSSGGSTPIYINPYSRNSASCSVPVEDSN